MKFKFNQAFSGYEAGQVVDVDDDLGVEWEEAGYGEQTEDDAGYSVVETNEDKEARKVSEKETKKATKVSTKESKQATKEAGKAAKPAVSKGQVKRAVKDITSKIKRK